MTKRLADLRLMQIKENLLHGTFVCSQGLDLLDHIAALEAEIDKGNIETLEVCERLEAMEKGRDALLAEKYSSAAGIAQERDSALQAAGRMRELLQKTYDADFFKHLDECKVQFHKGSPPTGCTCGISEIANEIRAALKPEGREP